MHNRAIAFVADQVKGTCNLSTRLWGMDRSFIPDVEGEQGDLHEVEVVKHKFNADFATQYLDAVKFGVSTTRKRGYTTLWLVIPNFHGVTKTFDEVRILLENKHGFTEISAE